MDNFEVIREKENLPSFDWRLLNIDFVKEMLVAVWDLVKDQMDQVHYLLEVVLQNYQVSQDGEVDQDFSKEIFIIMVLV